MTTQNTLDIKSFKLLNFDLYIFLLFLLSTPYITKSQNTLLNNNLQFDSVADIEGNIYKTIVIGTQTWMVENLKVGRFQNGDVIKHAQSAEEWKKLADIGTPAWCYYSSNGKAITKFGKLYNWYAIKDERKIAPKGWHIPSVEEWNTLINYLGGTEIAGKDLKSNSNWALNGKSNGNGTNRSGFNAKPGGYRLYEPHGFCNIGKSAFFWTSTEDEYGGFCTSLSNTSKDAEIISYFSIFGLSLRCIKD